MIFDFASLITAESEIIDSNKSDRFKLSGLGNIYYQCAEGLERKSIELLDLATRDTDSDRDSIINETFGQHLDSWMRTSKCGSFFDAYLQPRIRKPYERSNVEVAEISPVEAVEYFAIDEDTRDFAVEVLEIAYEENIDFWVGYLVEVMSLWGLQQYNFSQLVALTNLSPGQVFLAVFLSDCFILRRNECDFYGQLIVFKSYLQPNRCNCRPNTLARRL